MNESKSNKPNLLPRKRNIAASPVTAKAEKIINSRIEATKQTDIGSGEETNTPEQGATKKINQDMARLAKELDRVFNPDNFKGVVRAPADLMLAASGRKIWDIPDKEITSLAETGSVCARNFIKTDPKWLALILFSMSLFTTYGGRAAMHYKEVRAERVPKALQVKKEGE